MTPEQYTRARTSISGEIDRLIYLLDVIDGDADFEPSLGGAYQSPETLDLEFDDSDIEPNGDEGDGPDTDCEPSLGAPETGVNGSQSHWAQGSSDDREEAVFVDPAMRRTVAALRREADDARAAVRRLDEIIARVSAPHVIARLRVVS